jgi:hypothetical protein
VVDGPGRSRTSGAGGPADDPGEERADEAPEKWLCVLQDADGNEETGLVTIERNGDRAPPLIELTNGLRVTCTLPASTTGEAVAA